MIIDNAGTYTLKYTATDECGNSTTVDRELVVAEPVHIYGVFWDRTNGSKLTRTDESESFEDPIAAISNGTGSSPFDNLKPWSEMEVVEDAEAGTLVSIPKFYYKWTFSEGSLYKLQIADHPVEGFLTSPAHADRGDGVGERDVVYVGRYQCCETDYKSVSGIKPKKSTTIASFRNAIHSLGNDIWQVDYAMFWTICMLYLVEYANWDSQSTVGGGGSSTQNIVQNGQTDAMNYHTGTTGQIYTRRGEMQYRHIENLCANLYNFWDGIRFDGSNVYCIKNPSDFNDDSKGILVSDEYYTSSGLIANFTKSQVSGFEYVLLPERPSGSVTTNVYSNHSNGATRFSSGSPYYNYSVGAGILSNMVLANDSTASDYGSRLMKLPA